MHENIDKIKKLESSPKIIKNLFSRDEIDKFLNLYQALPTTVHNKKQNVIKKRWIKNYNEELEALFYNRVKNEIGDFKMDNLKDENNNDILGLFQESYNPIGLHVDAGFNLDEIIFKQTLIPLTSKGSTVVFKNKYYGNKQTTQISWIMDWKMDICSCSKWFSSWTRKYMGVSLQGWNKCWKRFCSYIPCMHSNDWSPNNDKRNCYWTKGWK